MIKLLRLGVVLVASCAFAQVYSPVILREHQPDPTNLQRFVSSIYRNANAHSPREKAEAIWRFFLTDGRFVKPGFWYHIAGWAYEEPTGEVLDPLKLLNSYGFGLCYHIAPLLEAAFEAGGFDDARVRFLTGHTVTEVFYEGAYHYFDSDMMGYNVAGAGFRDKPVASVRQLERDNSIMLTKLLSPKRVKEGAVDNPWYPADVRAAAMTDLAGLFTSTNDNYLFPHTRYSPGHSMDFTLRPGEKLIRFFAPEEPGLFYLPYTFDGQTWREFPQEIAQYSIRTADGPRSQKDGRMWGTGRIEYAPPHAGRELVSTYDMPSPYVIIDARFTIETELKSAVDFVSIETSTDGGSTWLSAARLQGPHQGEWRAEPKVLATTAHGRWTAVSGTYGYKVRITRSSAAEVLGLRLESRIQLNPRTLPALEPGENRMNYSTSQPLARVGWPVRLEALQDASAFELVTENGQSFLKPLAGKTGEIVLELGDGESLAGFDAGARFLELRDGLAPDKLTAETRHTGATTASGTATIEWSTSRHGPFKSLWTYSPKLQWRDRDEIDRVLLWPEVFREVRDLPGQTKKAYIRSRSAGPAIDSIRVAAYVKTHPPEGELLVTHRWTEGGSPRSHTERINATDRERHYAIKAGEQLKNESIILEVPAK